MGICGGERTDQRATGAAAGSGTGPVISLKVISQSLSGTTMVGGILGGPVPFMEWTSERS